MPTLHDYRSNFRFGRTGRGLRVRQDVKPYPVSVRDTDNWRMLANGDIKRRFGTTVKSTLLARTRLEEWTYANQTNGRFLLAFSNTRLDVHNGITGDVEQSFTSQPWDEAVSKTINLDFNRNLAVMADRSMKTKFLELDVSGVSPTFTMRDFAFDVSEDETRLRAPFFKFASETAVFTPTIFTARGEDTSLGTAITAAIGTPPGEFDLTAGTGLLRCNEDYFEAEHVGTRMRLDEGELIINAVNSATEAQITVVRDLVNKLDTNPLFFREGSTRIEVFHRDHRLKVGDTVFINGLSNAAGDNARSRLVGATAFGQTNGSATTYTIKKVVDSDHYEIDGDVAATTDELQGGSDVYVFRVDGTKDAREPVFSDLRGWPQAVAFHEGRLWLGGSSSLPDSAFASRSGAYTDFDTGTGAAADAIQLLGVGEEGVILHMVSDFDLMVVTGKAIRYVPHNPNAVITQETARALMAVEVGGAATMPRLYDGGLFFVDAPGAHIREASAASSETRYQESASTVVVSDWINSPVDSAIFAGAGEDATDYMMFTNEGDGSILVAYSSRVDDSFGWMRWTLGDGKFVSVTGSVGKLWVTAERDGQHYLLEFDTLDALPKMDFMESAVVKGIDLGTVTHLGVTVTHLGVDVTYAGAILDPYFVSLFNANKTVQIVHEGIQYEDAIPNADGEFTTLIDLSTITFGQAMPHFVEMNPPIAASGQGRKAGKMVRLVSAEVHWIETTTGEVDGQPILEPTERPLFAAPIPVDEWREYHPGIWDREPVLRIEGDQPGECGMRAATLNVYF